MTSPAAAPPPDPGTRATANLAAVYGLAALALAGLLRLLVSGGMVSPAVMRPLGFILVAAFPLTLVIGRLRARPRVGEALADVAIAADAMAADARHGEKEGTARAPLEAEPRFGGTGMRAAAGITALVLATWVALGGPEGGPEGPVPGGPVPAPRLLVLPLIDLDGRGDRYFADGVTDELTAALAMVDGMEVRGRVSAATRLDVNRDAGALAEEFGAAAALDGTIRRSGGRIRLNVRLLDAASRSVVWSVSRDTSLAGLFDVRDEVAREVTDALGLEMTEETERRLERRRTSVEALDLYMLGRFRWAAGPGGDLAEAASYYHLAIEADSSFAPAWTALAETYATLPRFTRFPPDAARRDGAAAARTALRLEPESASAQAALGEILFLYERDWTGARSHLARAIELDPGDGSPYDRLCELSLYVGDLVAAGERCEAARLRDPLAFRPAWLRARVDRARGEAESGLARLDSLVRAFPDFEPLAADLAIARLAATGSPGEAQRDLARWFALLADPEVADSLATTLGDAAADGSAVAAALGRLESRLRPDEAHLTALLTMFGLEERAEEVALSALEARSPGSLGFAVLPEFGALRSRPAVRARLQAAGLPVGEVR